jgi:hypothetical protein
MADDTPKSKGKPRNYKRLGCSFILFLGLAICSILWIMIVAPSLRDNIANLFLPPYCDANLLGEVLASPAARMRVMQDLYSETRVIAVGEEDRDICYLVSNTNVTTNIWPRISPNKQYLAFVSTHFIRIDNVVEYLFIVNISTGAYLHYMPENPEESFGILAWSPDSRKLAFSSHSNWAAYPSVNTYLNLLSLEADLIWRLELGNSPDYSIGYSEWTDDGEEILYGTNDPLNTRDLEPYWCTVKLDGTNLSCEEGAKP